MKNFYYYYHCYKGFSLMQSNYEMNFNPKVIQMIVIWRKCKCVLVPLHIVFWIWQDFIKLHFSMVWSHIRSSRDLPRWSFQISTLHPSKLSRQWNTGEFGWIEHTRQYDMVKVKSFESFNAIGLKGIFFLWNFWQPVASENLLVS